MPANAENESWGWQRTRIRASIAHARSHPPAEGHLRRDACHRGAARHFALRVLIGRDSGMVSIKPSKMGRPAQRDTEMLFFLLIHWILFNVFTSSPLLARNRATS
jgi:hypothetical protein